VTSPSGRDESTPGEPPPADTDQCYVLRLYVTGTTPRSMQAIMNIERICKQHLQGKVDLEVIDIYQKPELAKEAQIIAAPTLIKILPEPLRRAVGDLSVEEKVLYALDIAPPPSNGK
jgi:circadian clock protein KaiB